MDVHKLRNDSVIIDLMCGQYKSQVQCPIENCGKLSITFDPFFSMSLPIPSKKSKKIKVYFCPKDTFNVILLEIDFPKEGNHLIKDLVSDVLKKLGKPDDSECSFKLISSYYKDDVCLSDRTIDIKKKTDFKKFAIKELSSFELKIPKEDRIEIFLNVNYTCTEYYKKSIGSLYFFYADANWKVSELQNLITLFFQPLFPDLSETNYLKLVNSDNPPFSITLESNSRNWQQCYYCKKKCDKCDLSLHSEKLVGFLYECIPKNEQNFFLQINMIWFPKKESKIEMETIEDFFLNTKNPNEGETNYLQETPNYSLYDCLEKFREPEKLGEDNSWYCSNCKEHREAIKKLEIYKSPEVLVFHLKRFKEVKKMSGMTGLSKIDSFIDYPLELNLTDFVLSCSQTSSSSKTENKELIYELYGVVNHIGSINFGHYTSYCYNQEQKNWYLFDDSTVSLVPNIERVVNKNAYILFYRRKVN